MVSEPIKLNSGDGLHIDIFQFLDELRHSSGYQIGPPEYIAVETLLLKLAAEGSIPQDPYQLKSWIGPLICTNADEQQTFGIQFDNWIRRSKRKQFIRPLPEPEKKRPEPEHPAPVPDQDLQKIGKGATRWKWILIALVVVLSGSIIHIFTPIQQPGIKIIIEPEPSIDQPEEPSDKTKLTDTISKKESDDQNRFRMALIFLMILLAVYSAYHLWWRYWANQYFVRRQTSKDPDISNLFVKNVGAGLFEPIALFRTAQEFRKRVLLETARLDVDATIKESVKRGGIFKPIHATVKRLPEHLVLIDRASDSDHHTCFVDALTDHLSENDVLIHRYYFDEDPRNCHPEDGDKGPFNLWDLATLYPDHRLMIFSDPENFFDPSTGQPSPWIQTLSNWGHRAIYVNGWRRNSSYHLKKLEDLGFIILTADPEGLSGHVAHIHGKPLRRVSPEGKSYRFPRSLTGLASVWLRRRSPSKDRVDRLLNELYEYLGPDAYDWMTVCALYPEMNWDLTLFWGYNLKDTHDRPLFSEQRLQALSTLPWFQHGRMPDWLRRLLLDDLPFQKEKKIRQSMSRLLLTAIDQPLDGFKLEYAIDQNTILSRLLKPVLKTLSDEATPKGPLKDHIFLSFMENRLSVQIPRKLNRMLRQAARRIPSFWRKPKPALFESASSDLFTKPSRRDISLVFGLFSMIAAAIWINSVADAFRLNLIGIQGFMVFMAGYQYGKRWGILTGLLMFLPNTVFYYAIKTPELRGLEFLFDRSFIETIGLTSLSIGYYLLYSLTGYISYRLRILLEWLEYQYGFFGSTKEPAPRFFYWRLVPLYLCVMVSSYNILVNLKLSLWPVALIIYLHASIRYGFEKTLRLIYFSLPAFLIGGYVGPFSIGYLFSGYELYWLMCFLAVLGAMGIPGIKEEKEYSPLLFGILLPVAILLSFKYSIRLSDAYFLGKFTFYGYPFTLSLVLLAGYLFGPRKGFYFGIWWGLMTAGIGWRFMENVTFGSTWFLPMAAAPILGYLGGVILLKSDNLLEQALVLVSLYFSIEFVDLLLSDPLDGNRYLRIFLSTGQAAVLFGISHFVMWLSRTSATVSPDRFEKPGLKNFLHVVGALLVAAALMWGISVSGNEWRINLMGLQLFFVFIAGYRYGKRWGILTGLLLFLPNTVLHYAIKTPELKGLEFLYGRSSIGTIGLTTLSIGSYLLHSLAGYISFGLRILLERLQHQFEFFSNTKDSTPRFFYWRLVPLYVFGFMSYVPIGPIGISIKPVAFIIYLHASVRYGFEKTLRLIYFSLPVMLISGRLEAFSIGLFSGYQLFWLLCFLAIAAIMHNRIMAEEEGYSRFLYRILLVLGILLTFTYYMRDKITIFGYPFTLSLVLLAGYLFGPRKGFHFGIWWGLIAAGLQYRLIEYIRLWGLWFLPMAVAPILGYLGGTILKESRYPLRQAYVLLLAYFSISIVYDTFFYTFSVLSFSRDLFMLGQSIITFGILYFLLRRFKGTTFGNLSEIRDGQLFAKPSWPDNLLIAIVVIIGSLLAWSQYNYFLDYKGNMPFDFRPLQVLFVFLIGLRYGSGIGTLCALLIALPYVALPLMKGDALVTAESGRSIVQSFWDRSYLEKAIRLPKVYIILITFIFIAATGNIGGRVRSWFSLLIKKSDNEPAIAIDTRSTSRSVYYVLIPLYLFSFKMNFEWWFRITPIDVLPLVLLLIAFYFGFKQSILLIFWCLPIMIYNQPLEGIWLGRLYSGPEMLWLLALLTFAGALPGFHTGRKEITITINPQSFGYWIIACLLSVSYSVNIFETSFRLIGFPLSLALLWVAGNRLGSKTGLWLGALWGFTGIFQFTLTENLSIFGQDPLTMLSAPLIGYLGGSPIFRRHGETKYFGGILFCLWTISVATDLLQGEIFIRGHIGTLISYGIAALAMILIQMMASDKNGFSPENRRGQASTFHVGT